MHKRVEFSEEHNKLILKAYLEHTPGDIGRLVKQLKCDHKTLRKQADKLGVPKIHRYCNRHRWTANEIKLIDLYESLDCRQMSAMLAKHGYNRSPDSVDSFRRVNRNWLASIFQDEFADGYSTLQLSQILNVDMKTVHRWIRSGLLKAHQPHSENWRVYREDVLQFLLTYPSSWKAVKVDTFWLVDLINEFMIKKKVKEPEYRQLYKMLTEPVE